MKKYILFLAFFGILWAQDEVKINPALLKSLESAVEARFLEHYKSYNIKIEHLQIDPSTNLDLSKFKLEQIIFDESNLKKDNGSFEARLRHNDKIQRAFFSFKINAKIDALSAINNIKTNEVISENNAQISQIPIARNMRLPAKGNILNEYSAKSFIPSGSVIERSKITPKIIVNKGDVMSVVYKINGIDIYFDAKTLENGHLGQVIRAQNMQSNKNINIEIRSSKNAIFRGEK